MGTGSSERELRQRRGDAAFAAAKRVAWAGAGCGVGPLTSGMVCSAPPRPLILSMPISTTCSATAAAKSEDVLPRLMSSITCGVIVKNEKEENNCTMVIRLNS